MKPQLVTHRQAARELGYADRRDRFRALIVAGLPTVRHGGKDLIDIAAARAWLELFAPEDDEQPKRATQLHPADPRHAERSAAAAIAQIELALERGHAIRRADAMKRYNDAVFAFSGALDALPFSISHDDWRGDLEAACSAACELLSIEWPDPLPIAAPPVSDDGLPPNVEFLPLTSPGDPRHQYAAVMAQRRVSELAELRSAVVAVADAATMAEENFSTMRAAAARIPARVARHVAKHGTQKLHDWIGFEVEAAKAAMRGDDVKPARPTDAPSLAAGFDNTDGDPNALMADEDEL